MKDPAIQYIKDIRKDFSHFYKSERRFLKEFEQSVNEYVAHHPYTYNSLVQNFGTPSEIIDNYYYFRNEEKIIKQSKYSFHALVLISFLCIIVILSVIVYSSSNGQHYTDHIGNCDIGHYNSHIVTNTNLKE